MTPIHRLIVATIVSAFAGVMPASGASPTVPEIRISDVELFYRVYDAASGTPSADVLQRDYINAGSEGVRQFVPRRIVSAEALAKGIAANKRIYEKARECAAKLPDVKARLSTALAKLGTLLPEAKYPPVTILIGRANSGGTTGPAGVLIGLEMICTADWLEPALDDRLVHLIAHEYVHVQQTFKTEDAKLTVLEVSLGEGAAEFVGELISGSVSNVHLHRWTAGREAEIESAFLKDIDNTDLSAWLYNGAGTPEKPGDLGYWVGYRIAKSFYERAADKTEAMRRLMHPSENPKAILAESGWKPGGVKTDVK